MHQISRIETEPGSFSSFLNEFRSGIRENLTLQDPSSMDQFQESSLPTYCYRPLCKRFICYINALPIGHSVSIQLKATLRYKYFQSVS